MGGKGSGREKLTDEEVIREILKDENTLKDLILDLTKVVVRYERRLEYFIDSRT